MVTHIRNGLTCFETAPGHSKCRNEDMRNEKWETGNEEMVKKIFRMRAPRVDESLPRQVNELATSGGAHQSYGELQ